MDRDIVECLSCPPDNKKVATYRWHPGSVGVFPVCEEHAKEDLVDKEDLPEFRRNSEPVAGYLTPIDGSRKIRTWEEWDNYQEETDD